MGKRVSKKLKGFTLAEAMIATVLLGLAAAGLLMPFTSGMRVRNEGIRMTIAARLGADLTERIVATAFDEVIAQWDGYSEGQGQVKDSRGVVYSGAEYAKYSRQVSCEDVYVAQESGSFDPEFILVRVFVYYDSREMAVIDRLVANE